jgi:hypothetical protein
MDLRHAIAGNLRSGRARTRPGQFAFSGPLPSIDHTGPGLNSACGIAADPVRNMLDMGHIPTHIRISGKTSRDRWQ